MPPDAPDAPDQLEALRRENALLRLRVARLERELSSTTPLIEQARHLAVWDFTPYEITPDDSWVAVDRAKVMSLMGALARIDHWNPWGTDIEPRPQP
ncbi:hypothetical protein SAMN05216207_103930 [Pseudonocardia ammonioxydans]|uniref:Uncharacterized protein n=1 Tax=Pseudonocardia ammonioxydans TaxID=260086 RepID=A0A1I5FMJ9_PSUAM|nr:hypothetical protein [Pseudonocardia ammonioxydans]SFO24843.1 hypothetical protein SAMN05216207_103930 [Pseudonocardia ammonioxydans]